MIQLSAEITIFSEDNGNITEISDYIENIIGDRVNKSNISANLSDVLNKTDTKGGNPFLLGVSKIGDGSQLSSDKVDYYISPYFLLSEWYKAITITIYGDIKSATIVFDTYNGGHPKEMLIDNQSFSDDDPVFTISDTTTVDFWDNEENEHTIRISGWNKPNLPIIIQGIYITPRTLKIDRKNAISIECSIQDRSNVNLPSWGVFSNVGRIEAKDTWGEIKDFAEQGFLSDGQLCQIYIEDTIQKNKQLVGKFYTKDWDYDNNNKTFSVSIKDDMENMQEVSENAYMTKDTQTLWDIYNELFISEGLVIDIDTKNHLQSTKIRYPSVSAGTRWHRLTEFCIAAQCYVYCDNFGNRILKYNGGD